MTRSPRSIDVAGRQQGAVLVTALLFLLVMTVLGITAVTMTVLQQKLALGMREQSLSFHAAETALLDGERWVDSQISKPDFPDNANGLYLPYSCASSVMPVWECVNWSGTANVVVYSGTLAYVAQQPRYIVEDMGEVEEAGGSLVASSNYKDKGTTVLRITAYGTGARGAPDSSVTLIQSTYARLF